VRCEVLVTAIKLDHELRSELSPMKSFRFISFGWQTASETPSIRGFAVNAIAQNFLFGPGGASHGSFFA